MILWMCTQNLKFVASSLTRSYTIIAIEVLDGVANPNLGEYEAVGGRDGTVQKSVGKLL